MSLAMSHSTIPATSSYITTSSNPSPTQNYVLVNTFTFQKLPTHNYLLPTHNNVKSGVVSELLKLLAEIFPQPNELPTSMYKVKKAMSSLWMCYEKIHARHNDCVVYWKQCKDLECCLVYGVSRWKLEKNEGIEKKGVPAKVL